MEISYALRTVTRSSLSCDEGVKFPTAHSEADEHLGIVVSSQQVEGTSLNLEKKNQQMHAKILVLHRKLFGHKFVVVDVMNREL